MKEEILRNRAKLRKATYSALSEYRSSGAGSIVSGYIKDVLDKVFIYNTDRHYLSVSLDDPSQVSYCHNYRTVESFDSKRRRRVGVVRYFSRLSEKLDRNIPVNAWEDYAQCLLASLNYSSDQFEILYGSDVIKAYEEECGGHSCMTGKTNKHLIELYEKNADKVSLLTYRGTFARALLWKTDAGKKVMDRVYPNSGRHLACFARWAKENDYVCRKNNSLPEDNVHFEDDEEHRVTLNVGMTLPYMDSFHYAIDEPEQHRTIVLSTCKLGKAVHVASTTWYFALKTCCWCSTLVENQPYEELNGGYFCQNCYNEQTFECSGCSNRFRRTFRRSVEDSQYCQDCHNERFVRCRMCYDYLARSDEDNRVCERCEANPSETMTSDEALVRRFTDSFAEWSINWPQPTWEVREVNELTHNTTESNQ